MTTRNSIGAFQRHNIAKRHFQIARQPIDRFAKVLGTEFLHIIVQILSAAAQEVLKQASRRIFDAGFFLQLRSRAVKRAQRKGARAR